MTANKATRRRLLNREFNVMALLMFLSVPVHAQELHRHHPPQDVPLHEKFYSTWFMPDKPGASCCNKADCYPTEVRFRNGHWQAKRREDGKWLWVPDSKVERNRDNPDGRNHLCAPPPAATSYPADTVFCFALGSGT